MDKITIRNFGPIKDINIELSKLMVFIGPQGSGKSTIAKLLTIFSDVYWWATICSDKDPLVEFKKMGLATYFTPAIPSLICLYCETTSNFAYNFLF